MYMFIAKVVGAYETLKWHGLTTNMRNNFVPLLSSLSAELDGFIELVLG